jgi:hypothetical protein
MLLSSDVRRCPWLLFRGAMHAMVGGSKMILLRTDQVPPSFSFDGASIRRVISELLFFGDVYLGRDATL